MDFSAEPPPFRTCSATALGHCENPIVLLVEHQMVIPNVRSAHVLVKLLGVEVKRKDIHQDSVHECSHFLSRLRVEVGWCQQRCFSHVSEILCALRDA